MKSHKILMIMAALSFASLGLTSAFADTFELRNGQADRGGERGGHDGDRGGRDGDRGGRDGDRGGRDGDRGGHSGYPGPVYPGPGYPGPVYPGPVYPGPGPGRPYPVRPSTVVSCESNGYSLQRCFVGGAIQTVAIEYQRSSSGCALGRSWGYNQDSIWVNSGCRADFRVFFY